MNASVLVAFGGVFLFAALCAAFVVYAGNALRAAPDKQETDTTGSPEKAVCELIGDKH